MFGTSDAIAIVQDLEVLPDGSVWVLNSVEPFFVGFSPDGSVLRVHGRSGGGPGEFGAPSGFVHGGIGGETWTFDRRRHAIMEVSRADSAGREILLPQDAIPPGSVMGGMDLTITVVRTARFGDELILPRRSNEGETDVFGYWLSVWTADLIALDPVTDSVREVVDLGSILGDPAAHFEMVDDFPPIPLWYRLWAVCSDDEIRVHDRLRNELRGFTRDGVELDAIALPPPHYDAVTTRQFARATAGLAIVEAMGEVRNTEVSAEDSARAMERLLPRLTAEPEQLANLLPRYVDFRCDEDGTQWLRPFDIDLGGMRGGPVWLRIAPDGVTREVLLPDRFDPYRFTPERIWGVQRNELDVASVAWIALPDMRR